MRKKTIAVGLLVLASLTGCTSKEIVQEASVGQIADASEIPETVKANKSENKITTVKYSLGALKEKYDYDDSNYISPIYNVDQQTCFTFKFKSKVNPSKAITVHTDPSCNIESMVYQTNYGFVTEDNGREIVVAPTSPVLNTAGAGNAEMDTWGNAPIYYICIRYDMNSENVKELSDPIVVPFTIKRDVNMPNLKAVIDEDGTFKIKWNEVDGAKEYKVYKSTLEHDSAATKKNLTRQQCGYMGDHLELVKTTKDCEYIPEDWKNDTQMNGFNDQSIFVVAVTEDGKESGVSIPVSTWKYSMNAPRQLKDDLKYNNSYLQASAKIEMADGSEKMYPVNYYKEDGGYRYEIPGTTFTGHVDTDTDFGEQVINKTDTFNSLLEDQIEIPAVPDNTVKTNTEHVLNHKLKKVNMLQMRDGATLERAEIENVRMLARGVYSVDPLSIEYYDSSELDRDWVEESGNSSSNFETAAVDEKSDTVEEELQTEEETETDVSKVKEETEKDETIDETLESILETETDEETEDIIEETEETTEEDKKDDNEIEVYGSDYLVVADSAAEEYLALNIINSNEIIDLTVMPELQNQELLNDMYTKVVAQNPYGNYIRYTKIAEDGSHLKVSYAEDKETWERKKKEIADKAKEIDNEIIRDSMTDEEKIEAIWDYIVDRGSYNWDAIENAKYTYQIQGDLADNWTPYGTLMNDLAVCEGKSKAFITLAKEAGIDDVIEVTGSAGGPHAWNAVKLGDKWYYLDTTAGDQGPIEKYVYLSSAEYMSQLQDYVFDTGFCLDSDINEYVADSNDLSHDWYMTEHKLCNSRKEMEESFREQFESGSEVAVAKVAGEVTDEALMTTLNNLYSDGVISDDLVSRINMGGYSSGYCLIGHYDMEEEK